MSITAWSPRVREWALKLVALPSITNTRGETEFAMHLYNLLVTWPYFRAHPEDLLVEPTVDDLHERSNLFALVRGDGPATVVLSGHYDVVAVENYGRLLPWAFDPEALLPRLIGELDQSPSSESDRRALHDLRTGNFLPGRGMLDMKSGLAAGIAALQRFACAVGDRRGNLLFVATPDEEDSSHGMRSAALRLSKLAEERALSLEAAINLDASDDPSDGSEGQAIFLGTVGKLLPFVYLVGHETHAGSPFSGINPNLLAAEVTRRVECNNALADRSDGAPLAPPVCLKQVDLKTHYDVTTPAAAWCYYNVLTRHRTAAEVLETMVSLVRAALDGAVDYLREQARLYGELSRRPGGMPVWRPRVLTFAQLRDMDFPEGNAAAEESLCELTASLVEDAGLDLPAFSCRVVEALWARTGLTGPAAVVGFGSLHYPPGYVGSATPRQVRLRGASTRQAETVGRDLGVSIHLRSLFPGISDMSFLGGAISPEDAATVTSNTPAWGSRLRFDYAAVRALNLPTINVGPWGRDYHQRTERVFTPYSFAVVPELIWRIVRDLLDDRA